MAQLSDKRQPSFAGVGSGGAVGRDRHEHQRSVRLQFLSPNGSAYVLDTMRIAKHAEPLGETVKEKMRKLRRR